METLRSPNYFPYSQTATCTGGGRLHGGKELLCRQFLVCTEGDNLSKKMSGNSSVTVESIHSRRRRFGSRHARNMSCICGGVRSL
jgi:hypothetical protein